MKCLTCDAPINEHDFHINCSDCGEFCSEICYMKHHDKLHGCVNTVKSKQSKKTKK